MPTTAIPRSDYQEEWVKILAKGMITIPKPFREQLGIKEGEVARIKKIGQRLVIEPREITNYEVYGDKELREMLKKDRLPSKLANEAASFWSDMK